LAAILGENYTSSEHALRELVDNSWEAEARRGEITLDAEIEKHGGWPLK
jgi:hypothetical protein